MSPKTLSASILFAASIGAAGCGVAAEDRTIERRVAADPRGTLAVSNVAGSLQIMGWDRAEVEVRGELEEGVERVDVLTEGSRTVVKVVLPRVSHRRGGEAELVIHAPRDIALEVSTVSADITARDVLGAQRLKSVSGEVDTQVGRRDLEVKTVSGDVALHGSSQSVAVRATTVSGEILYRGGAGSLDAQTVSGDLNLRMDPASAVRVDTTSGNFSFDGRLTPDARIDVQTMSGDVSLSAVAPQGLAVEARSFSGDIDNCFGVKSERESEHGPGTRLEATRGAGKARITLKTFSGNVEVCDR